MTESLVIIRTFGNLLEADDAQIELLSAGIYSLLMSEEGGGGAFPPAPEAIALAVHRRDADAADALLSPLPDTR